MKRTVLWILTVLAMLALPLTAQKRQRDPLTEAEVDQMREAADFPNKRLELLVKFNRDRVAQIDQLMAGTAAPTTSP